MSSHPGTPFGIRRLHHFTDARNVESVLRYGLLCRSALRREDLSTFTTSNEVSRTRDDTYGHDAYVHLSLTPNHPMKFVALNEGRVTRLVDIVVDPVVLTRPGVMLTLDIANKLDGSLTPIAIFSDSLRVGVVYKDYASLDDRGRARVDKLRRYEILVPGRIEPELLTISANPVG